MKTSLPGHGGRVANVAAREASAAGGAFTLIEIMVVVAIFGIVLTMGVPSIYRVFHKESLRTAVNDIVNACNKTRAQAILRGEKTELRLHPREQGLGLGGAGAPSRAEGGAGLPGSPAGRSDRISLEMLDVNFIEYKEAEEARVRFYANGTCDELTIVLRSDQNEYRKISLECSTGLATVETIR
jgi:prepilin-type N-terminal cleavage/methylation domain-containing protein